jgi:membrane-associated phospholipid phosphatase
MAKARVEQRRKLTKAEKADLKMARAAALESDSRAQTLVAGFRGIGDQPPMTAASATVLACGLAFRDRKMARTGIRMLAALGLATVVKGALKDNVDRTRPGEVLDNGGYRLKPGASKAKALRSFPSGHSAGAAAVFAAAAREYPGAGVPLMGAAGAIAAAQLPSRNHFLTDVAAGFAIGLLSEWLASRAIDRLDEALA